MPLTEKQISDIHLLCGALRSLAQGFDEVTKYDFAPIKENLLRKQKHITLIAAQLEYISPMNDEHKKELELEISHLNKEIGNSKV